MDTMPDNDEFVIVGVDTHADTHVVVVVDTRGQLLAGRAFPATRAGYGRLVEWASTHGPIDRIGIEGTGSWGRGLTLFCTTLPKTGDGPVEMIRVLHITRETAVKARTQAINQLRGLVVTAPLELAEQRRGLSRRRLIATTSTFDPRTRRRPHGGHTPGDAQPRPTHPDPERRDRRRVGCAPRAVMDTTRR